MLKNCKIWIVLAILGISCHNKDTDIAYIKFQEKDIGFEMPVLTEPGFPDNSVSITDFGAKNDGQFLCTKAISDAIDAITKKGGGTVIIPRGLWLTGPIVLKSNVNIRADEGALIVFSSDKNLYPLVETSFEGNNTFRCISPVYAKDLENIAITGKGVFDGSGEAWRPVKKEKMTESAWKSLVKSGGVVSEDGKIWYPSESYLNGQNLSSMNVPDNPDGKQDFEKIKDFLRPVMISLVNCKKVLLDGPVFQNSPAWCIHPLMCEGLIIRNVTVKNPWFSQNGDGLDIESCKNSYVYDCNFDVGDDAICIKSGKDAEGRKRAKPAENIVIKNCTVYHGHGGVTIGSEMSGGVRNMYVSGCTFIGTDVGLRFKSNRGRGGVVENVLFTDINMINIPIQAIAFNMYYGGLSVPEVLADGLKENNRSKPVATEETPQFRNITIRNLVCKGASEALLLEGLPELKISKINLENIFIQADNGITCMDASGIIIKGLEIISKNPEFIQIINSRDIKIENLWLPEKEDSCIVVKGKESGDISIRLKNPGKKIRIITDPESDTKTINIL